MLFDKNKILLHGVQLHPDVNYLGLQSMWKTTSGDLYVRSKLDLDTDGPLPENVEPETYHQDQTNLQNPDGTYISSYDIPYIVLPGGLQTWLKNHAGIDIPMGAIGAVQYNGKSAFVVFADIGPATKIGEGSIALHRALGFERVRNGKIIDVGIDSDVEWVVFQQTGNGKGRTVEEINAAGATYLKRLNGS